MTPLVVTFAGEKMSGRLDMVIHISSMVIDYIYIYSNNDYIQYIMLINGH